MVVKIEAILGINITENFHLRGGKEYMPIREMPFETGSYYHIFNRGVDRFSIFRTATEYRHFISALEFYRYIKTPIKFSHYCSVSNEAAGLVRQKQELGGTHISVFAYALMPNHFHLLVRQDVDDGIHTYLFKALNSYAKYFNTKRKRVGPIFQGNFKAVRIETDEQLLHVSRYIHLNPVTAGMITMQTLSAYPWTSYPSYVRNSASWIDTSEVLGLVGSKQRYIEFVSDQVEYAKTLSDIRHTLLDDERSSNSYPPATSEVAVKNEAKVQ